MRYRRVEKDFDITKFDEKPNSRIFIPTKFPILADAR